MLVCLPHIWHFKGRRTLSYSSWFAIVPSTVPQYLFSELGKQWKILKSTFGWIKLLFVASTLKIYTHVRKVIYSPHSWRKSLKRRRKTKRQGQRKPKNIFGEYQTSWVGASQSRYKWEARRLELWAGSDLVSSHFELYCVSFVYSPYVVSPCTWAPRGWPMWLQASGQRSRWQEMRRIEE